VALSGDGTTAMVGAPLKSNGAAYAFTSGASWADQSNLPFDTGNSASENFGLSVALSNDGNTAVVGADYATGVSANTGAASVYTSGGGSWSKVATLTASSGVADDLFGTSVALSGDGTTAMVGAPAVNYDTGEAYVFTASGGSWADQSSTPFATGVASGDKFGYSVALSRGGTTAMVGAPFGSSSTGEAYVFTTSGGGSWSQAASLTATGGMANDEFGNSVALSRDGTTAVVGAHAAVSYRGAAYVFKNPGGGGWSQVTELTASGVVTDDELGSSVALSGDGTMAVVGAHAQYANNAAGAAYSWSRGC